MRFNKKTKTMRKGLLNEMRSPTDIGHQDVVDQLIELHITTFYFVLRFGVVTPNIHQMC